jgi:hypothetical protein
MKLTELENELELHDTLVKMFNIVESIKSNQVYQQVIKDSFGGVMYNVANRGKYDTKEIIKLWNELTPAYQDSVDGIMKGAINFINE